MMICDYGDGPTKGAICERNETLYERFTDRARKVMQLAKQEAQRLNHDRVDSAHVLIALLKEDCGIAANVLKNHGATLRLLRTNLEALVKPVDYMTMPIGEFPQSDSVRFAVLNAQQIAKGFDHGYVGTEHLLLAIAAEKDTVCAKVIEGVGLSEKSIWQEVSDLLHPRKTTNQASVDLKLNLDTSALDGKIAELRHWTERAEKCLAQFNAAREVGPAAGWRWSGFVDELASNCDLDAIAAQFNSKYIGSENAGKGAAFVSGDSLNVVRADKPPDKSHHVASSSELCGKSWTSEDLNASNFGFILSAGAKIDAVELIKPAAATAIAESGQCTCPTSLLMTAGCQCGALKR